MSEAHRRARAKGLRAQLLARDLLKALEHRVEVAPSVPLRWKDGKPLPPGVVLTRRHDYFSLWDLLYACRDGTRGYVQVTSGTGMHARRLKILRDGFPCTPADLIMVYIGRATFKVARGPVFIEWEFWRLRRRAGGPADVTISGEMPDQLRLKLNRSSMRNQ